MFRKLLFLFGVLAVVFVVATALAVNGLIKQSEAPFRGYSTDEAFVDIKSGDSTQVIAQKLVDSGVVRGYWPLRLAVWRSGQERKLQAGEYQFSEAVSPTEVVHILAKGRVFLRRITFPEGLNIEEMADVFALNLFGTRESFISASRRVELIKDLDSDAENLEGYLFPETYSLPRDGTAMNLVEAMVAQFRATFVSQLKGDLLAGERTVRDIVTLASLVQKETGNSSEHSVVSAVYTNRLRIGMRLQCDPTVIYALQLDGSYDGNLTRTNLQFDSPYNTYVYGGLPPGPIASPGLEALRSVFEPADVSYLYFVSRNDGSHAFSDTLREHNRNVRKYQIEYFRRQRNSR